MGAARSEKRKKNAKNLSGGGGRAKKIDGRRFFSVVVQIQWYQSLEKQIDG